MEIDMGNIPVTINMKRKRLIRVSAMQIRGDILSMVATVKLAYS